MKKILALAEEVSIQRAKTSRSWEDSFFGNALPPIEMGRQVKYQLFETEQTKHVRLIE